ncbi:hypothetical protein DLV40_10225 [Shigella flexneri]|nr:hypothetical protein [Shigella flexneri]
MNKEIQVKVDTSRHGVQDLELVDASIYERDGELFLHFTKADNELHRVRDDEDGCPVFGWYGVDFPLYAYHYPDGQEDWTTQAIFDELNGVPLEDEVSEPTLLTFTFIKEEKVGDISVTEALQVTQVL